MMGRMPQLWSTLHDEDGDGRRGIILRETAELVALLPSLVDYTLDCAIEKWVEER